MCTLQHLTSDSGARDLLSSSPVGQSVSQSTWWSIMVVRVARLWSTAILGSTNPAWQICNHVDSGQIFFYPACCVALWSVLRTKFVVHHGMLIVIANYFNYWHDYASISYGNVATGWKRDGPFSLTFLQTCLESLLVKFFGKISQYCHEVWQNSCGVDYILESRCACVIKVAILCTYARSYIRLKAAEMFREKIASMSAKSISWTRIR